MKYAEKNDMKSTDKLRIGRTAKGKSIIAASNFQKGDIILPFKGDVVQEPGKYTLQIDKDRHLLETSEIFSWLNHSCDANAYIDFDNLVLKALRDIETDEEITFNYMTSEWELSSPFACLCNMPSCLKVIQGFKHVSQTKMSLKPLLSPYLINKAG